MFKILVSVFKEILKKISLITSIPKPKDCLVESLSIDEAEKKMLDFLEQFRQEEWFSKTLAEHEKWIIKCWNPFISKMKSDDTLWYFNTPDIFWENSIGYDGFIILRSKEQKIVAKLIFKRS